VSAYEVELVINDIPGVHESAAIGVPSEIGEEEILVVVQMEPGADPDAEAIATQPMVMFAALPTDSPQYIPGEQEAFCLWFVPTNTWLKRTVDKFTGAINYSLQGSYYDPRLDASADIENPPTPVGLGVHGIIRYFRSHASAVAAHGQLREAMRTYHAQIRLLEAGPRSLGGDNRAVVDAERRSSQPAPRRI
jgi:hypothetical protein